MFVLSVFDDGGERNFVTTNLRVDDGRIFAVVGGATRQFEIDAVIDLMLIECADHARNGLRTEGEFEVGFPGSMHLRQANSASRQSHANIKSPVDCPSRTERC